MSLIVIFGLWLFLGGTIYRARKHARSVSEGRAPGHSDIVPGHRSVRAEVPDTVPCDWVEAYRAEHGG